MSMPLYSADGRPVAALDGVILRKRAVEAKHRLYAPPAWSIDRVVVEDAVRAGARRIEIVTTDTGKTYRVDMATFLDKAEKMNRGHNDQLRLRLEFWADSDERQLSML